MGHRPKDRGFSRAGQVGGRLLEPLGLGRLLSVPDNDRDAAEISSLTGGSDAARRSWIKCAVATMSSYEYSVIDNGPPPVPNLWGLVTSNNVFYAYFLNPVCDLNSTSRDNRWHRVRSTVALTKITPICQKCHTFTYKGIEFLGFYRNSTPH